MLKLLKKQQPWVPSFDEISQYSVDLQRIMALREKSQPGEELEHFNRTIHVMQEVMIYLNTDPAKILDIQ